MESWDSEFQLDRGYDFWPQLTPIYSHGVDWAWDWELKANINSTIPSNVLLGFCLALLACWLMASYSSAFSFPLLILGSRIVWEFPLSMETKWELFSWGLPFLATAYTCYTHERLYSFSYFIYFQELWWVAAGNLVKQRIYHGLPSYDPHRLTKQGIWLNCHHHHILWTTGSIPRYWE